MDKYKPPVTRRILSPGDCVLVNSRFYRTISEQRYYGIVVCAHIYNNEFYDVYARDRVIRLHHSEIILKSCVRSHR